MILGKQVRTSRNVIVNKIPLSRECIDHTPVAIVAKMKSFEGQAIPVEMMTGIEQMTATIKLGGSVAAARVACGAGFAGVIPVVVSDTGKIGDSGVPYVHTYIYSGRVKSITPATGPDGEEGAEIVLSISSYEFKMDGVTIDEINGQTGLVKIGQEVIVPAVV